MRFISYLRESLEIFIASKSKMIKVPAILAGLYFFGIAVSLSAFEQNVPHPVQAKIITDNEKITPGKNIKVAVHFRLDPGWHIYWKNSGDSGLPTKVSYTVPKGFEVKDTHYPVPNTFLRQGNILDYGYENELLLVTDISVPKDASADNLKIDSQAMWVVCKEVCIPGSKELVLKFPIRDKNLVGESSLFNSWQSRLPLKISGDKLPFRYSVNKKFNAGDKLSYVEITMSWKEQTSEINIFPNPDKSIYLKDVSLRNGIKNSTFGFTPVIFKKGQRDIEEIEFVISFRDADGKKRAIETIIDLRS